MYAFLGIDFPTGPYTDRATPLSHHLFEDRGLLILDGLEPLQSAPGERTGSVHDVELRRFLQMIQYRNLGSCIITSRIAPADINILDKHVSYYQLDNLTKTDAVSMLRHLGVKGKIEHVSEAALGVNFNPLTLRLLGNYLRLVHNGQAVKWRELNLLEEDAKQGGAIQKILSRYSRWLGESDNVVWSLVGFFRRPATRMETETLWKSLNGILVKSATGDSDLLSRAVSHLSQLGLLYSPTSSAYLDCHPVIRQYQRELGDVASQPRIVGHLALGHLLEKSVGDRPSSLSEFLLVYDAVFHFVSAGHLVHAWEHLVVKKLWQGEFASTAVFGMLSEELSALRGFFEVPFTQTSRDLSDSQRAALGSQVAFILSSLNKLDAAMDIQAENYRLRSELADWERANIAAGSAAEYGLIVGDIRRSVGFMALAMSASRRLSETRWRLAALCTAGTIRHEMGRSHVAKSHFARAARLFEQTRKPDEKYLGKASGFNLLWCLTDLLEDEVWEYQYGRRDSLEEAFVVAEGYLGWSDHCIAANENSSAPIPLYEAFFKIVRARLCSILQLKVGSADSCSISTDIEQAQQALQRSGLTRFDPLVSVIGMDRVIYSALSLGAIDGDLSSSVGDLFDSAQDTVRDGRLERYAGMLELRMCRLDFVSGMLSEERFSSKRYSQASLQLRLYGLKRLSDHLDRIISVRAERNASLI